VDPLPRGSKKEIEGSFAGTSVIDLEYNVLCWMSSVLYVCACGWRGERESERKGAAELRQLSRLVKSRRN
jgi:hypothetical protein